MIEQTKAVMRVLLRNTKTGLYLSKDEGWTADSNSARTFRHSAEAMDEARKTGLQEVEVLLTFDEPPAAVALPIP